MSVAHRELWKHWVEGPDEIRFGLTSYELSRERQRLKNSGEDRPLSEKTRRKMEDIARIFAEKHEMTSSEFARKAGIYLDNANTLLTSCEHRGLYLYQDDGIVGCINAEEWLKENVDTEDSK